MADEAEEVSAYKVPSQPGFEVYQNQNGDIVIKQDTLVAFEESFVVIPLERADQLIEFIRAVREEVLTDRADAAAAQDYSPLSGR